MQKVNAEMTKIGVQAYLDWQFGEEYDLGSFVKSLYLKMSSATLPLPFREEKQ
jgi:hypothetical protein